MCDVSLDVFDDKNPGPGGGQFCTVEALPALCMAYGGERRELRWANAAARRVFGLEPGNICVSLTSCLSAQDAERLELAEHAARGAQPGLTEIRALCTARGEAWLQCSVSASPNGDFTMVAHEVDALKEAESVLERSHEALLTITQNVDCAIFTAQTEGDGLTLVYANDAFYDMLGYTQNELGPGSERLNETVFSTRDSSRLLRNISLGAQSNAFEGRLVRKGGAGFWVTLRSRSLGGGLFVCTFQDIDHLKAVENELQLSNSRYRLLLGNLGGHFYEIDLRTDTIYRTWSEKEDILPQKELAGLPGSLFDTGMFFEQYRDAVSAAYRRIKAGSEKEECIVRCNRMGGEPMWAEVGFFCIYDHHRHPVHALVIIKDITRQRELELSFKSEEQYRETMVGSSVAVVKFSLASERVISYFHCGKEVCPAVGRAVYLPELFLTARSVIHPDESRAVSEFYSARRISLEHARRGVQGDYLDFRMKKSKKEPYIWVRGTLTVLTSPENGEPICFSYITDINEQKEKELDLLKKAETDVLTGIFNRTAIKTRVDSFLAQGGMPDRIHALIMLDLDGFKQVNDNYGHETGDGVLRELSDKLSRSSRTSDYVARLGGDEFLVFLKDAKGYEDIARKAQKICEICSDLHIDGKHASFLSGSIGIAVAPRDGISFDELYRRADKAMYMSKETGKNCVSFFS